MQTKRIGVLVGALALALVAAACGDDSGSSATTAGGATTAKPTETTAGGATTAKPTETTAGGGATTSGGGSPASTMALADLKGSLNGSGATFPKLFYEDVIAALEKDAPNLKITYAGGGSGKGRTDLQQQVVQYAGTDSAVKDEDLASYKGGAILHFPTVLGPITLSYNLPGVSGLKLDCATIAGIFQRTIKTWNDPAIAALNSGVSLPSTAITPVRRSDSSGTTDNFTKYLDAACGSKGDGTWKLKSGSTVEWPADTQAGNGNGGVTQVITQTPGAIGYVDFADATAAKLTFADIKNKAGNFVAPSIEGASAAGAGAKINPNLTFSAIWADGADAYPITAQTWIIVYKKQPDATTAQNLKGFLGYILSPEGGQKMAPDSSFAPLPKGLEAQAIAQLDQITS